MLSILKTAFVEAPHGLAKWLKHSAVMHCDPDYRAAFERATINMLNDVERMSAATVVTEQQVQRARQATFLQNAMIATAGVTVAASLSNPLGWVIGAGLCATAYTSSHIVAVRMTRTILDRSRQRDPVVDAMALFSEIDAYPPSFASVLQRRTRMVFSCV